jgi:hypothetical protein
MKEFCLIILLAYFGFRLLMGLFVIHNWDTPKFKEEREKTGNNNINQYYHGVIENILLILISSMLYGLQ